MKSVIVSVSNDLVTDQRVNRVCSCLVQMGFRVLLVGRVLKDSPAMEERPYPSKRMRLLFNKGPLFYAEYNIRLFLFLLFKKADILVSNDLDTLPANYFASKLKGCRLVYDSHEYFTEVPELQNSPWKKAIWKKTERLIFPKLNCIFTVNESIADLYRKEYNKEIHVVRNVPERINDAETLSRKELGLQENKKLIILQGSGINVQRGAEEAVESMQYVDGAVLLIAGSGDVIPLLKKITERLNLKEKVLFIPRQPYRRLMQYTRQADIGLSLDKDTSLNYRYSLPNKLFDYLHAGIAVLASPLPEVKKIIETWQTGRLIENHAPRHIASVLNAMLSNEEELGQWKSNSAKAAGELNWEKEKIILEKVYEKFR